MVSGVIIYGLAAIGAIVVLAVLAFALYLAFGFMLIAIGVGFDRISAAAFRVGGGRDHQHPDGERHPRAPYDRIWIETLWLKRWTEWLIRELGYSSWNNTGTPGRPDIKRLHELRKETYNSP